MAGRRPKQAIQRRGTSPFSTPTRWHLSPRRKKRRSQGMEYQPILVRERTTIGQRANHYWSENEPLLVRSRTNSGSYHPPTRSPILQQHRSTTSSYNKARYTELRSQPDKGRKPSASPLARELALGCIRREGYRLLPVEVVDAYLTARTYAVGRTRRADT